MDHNLDVGGARPSVSAKYGTSISSNPYNPAAVQQQINALLSEVQKGHPLSMAQINYVMSLCGTYRSDVVGNDAAELAQINKYFAYIQDLTTQVNNAADPSTSGDPDGGPTMKFFKDIRDLEKAVFGSHYFTKGAGSSLAAQITAALDNVMAAVFPKNAQGGYTVSANALQNIWIEASGSPGVSGSPSAMSQLNQALGSVSQIYTGVSKSAQAQIQSDNSILTAVNNAIASMEKKILEIISASVNAATRS